MLGAPIGLVWAACFEREMVREGDMNYKLALNSSFGISSGVPLQSSNPLRQSKTSVIVFISLCARAGDTEYYLSRKFKEEAGVSLNNYINIAKIERAKLLLTITGAGIQEISDRLHFCSRSYFSEAFRKFTGTSPAKYRSEHQKGRPLHKQRRGSRLSALSVPGVTPSGQTPAWYAPGSGPLPSFPW